MVRIVVLGAGFVGLSTALLLLRGGYKDVHILTKDRPPNTTSNAAGAFWSPVLDEPASSRRNLFSIASRKYTYEHIIGKEGCGLVERYVDEYFDSPEFCSHADSCSSYVGFQEIKKENMLPSLPPSFLGGFTFLSYVADTDVYLNYLVDLVEKEGGKITLKDVKTKDELLSATADYDVLFNCSGLGAGVLFGDTGVFPIRGQTVLVDPIPGIDRVFYSNCLVSLVSGTEFGYVIPRQTDCVLGGTYEQDNWNLEPTQQDTDAILKKVEVWGVVNPRIQRVRVGLRPGRSEPRIEAERLERTDGDGDGPLPLLVIHNYGHGSRGFTLSWGTALEAIQIFKEQYFR